MCRAFPPDCRRGYTTDISESAFFLSCPQDWLTYAFSHRVSSNVLPRWSVCPYWGVEPSFLSAGGRAALLLQYPVMSRASYPRASEGQVQCSMTWTPAAAILPTQHGPQQQLKAVCYHGLGGSIGHADHYDLGGSIALRQQQGLKWLTRPWASAEPLLVTGAMNHNPDPHLCSDAYPRGSTGHLDDIVPLIAWPYTTNMSPGVSTGPWHWYCLRWYHKLWPLTLTMIMVGPKTQILLSAEALVRTIPWPQVTVLNTEISMPMFEAQPLDTTTMVAGCYLDPGHLLGLRC